MTHIIQLFTEMESRLAALLGLQAPTKGNHHHSTILFWTQVALELERGTNNKIKSKFTPTEYQNIKRLAHVGSNRTPCNEIAVCYVENALNGCDV